MRKFLAVAALSLAGMAGWGCSSACDSLQSQCDKCSNASLKSTCQQTVSEEKALGPSGEMGCQSILDQKTFTNCAN